MSEQESIDSYLDDLARALKIDRARARRVLAETEDHLREATHDIRETGVDEDEAAHLAIERFGTATAVANRFSTELRPPFQAILVEMAIALAGIAAVGLIAIGISGGLAGVFGKTFGWSFVAGDQPGVTYTAERCAEYLRYSPSATTCAQAALDDHSFEVVGYRIAAGVFGLIVLGAYLVARHMRGPDRARLPGGFSPIVGSALFGLAAAGLLGFSTLNIIFSNTSGTGGLLSGGIVSLAVFAIFGLRLVRELTSPAAT
jgi:hypothetical protein